MSTYNMPKFHYMFCRLRENAPHLLDIDGDCCHHIHNAVKISETFDKMSESVFQIMLSDFHGSCDLRDYLKNSVLF